ncbi:MAG: glycosyl hydrolase [Myxococcales bacterium]
MRKYFAALLLALAALIPMTASANAAVSVGMGDQSPQLFSTPSFQKMKKIKTVRYIAPWDVENDPAAKATADLWIKNARANGYKVHVTFNYSLLKPEKLPSVAAYTKATKAFVARHKSDVEVWGVFNEANRGTVKGRFATPGPKLAAQYFVAFRKSVCKGCKIVGLDVLDGNSIKPTLTYVKSFLKNAKGAKPTIWGFHNYSDTNRFSTTRTAAFLKVAKGGQVWLTETGGLYRLGNSFKPSTSRQAKATTQVFKIATKYKSRIKRVYFYNFFAPNPIDRPDDIFDAGLIDPDGDPRPAYDILLAKTK